MGAECPTTGNRTSNILCYWSRNQYSGHHQDHVLKPTSRPSQMVRATVVPCTLNSPNDDSVAHLLVRGVLGIVLLSNIALDTIYSRVGEVDNVFAGMLPFNASLATTDEARLSLPGIFMLNTNL